MLVDIFIGRAVDCRHRPAAAPRKAQLVAARVRSGARAPSVRAPRSSAIDTRRAGRGHRRPAESPAGARHVSRISEICAVYAAVATGRPATWACFSAQVRGSARGMGVPRVVRANRYPSYPWQSRLDKVVRARPSRSPSSWPSLHARMPSRRGSRLKLRARAPRKTCSRSSPRGGGGGREARAPYSSPVSTPRALVAMGSLAVRVVTSPAASMATPPQSAARSGFVGWSLARAVTMTTFADLSFDKRRTRVRRSATARSAAARESSTPVAGSRPRCLR